MLLRNLHAISYHIDYTSSTRIFNSSGHISDMIVLPNDVNLRKHLEFHEDDRIKMESVLLLRITKNVMERLSIIQFFATVQ